MKRSILAAALLVALTADARASSSVGGPDPAARHPFFVKPIRIVAHRGGVALAPENTLEAFRAVVERWPDAVIESDVRLTSDAVPVLLHDPTVDRTTDGTGEVARLSLVALQAYDAGYRFSPDGGRTFPSRGHGVRVPTLEATLRALPGTRFEIELKEGTDAVPAVVGAVRNANATERVLLVSPRAEVLARIRALAPAIATNLDEASAHALVTALRSGSRPAAPPAGQLLTADPRQLADAGIGRADIAALARVGVPVQAFTIDDAGEMRRLLDLGVTSLVTQPPRSRRRPRRRDTASRPRVAARGATSRLARTPWSWAT
ncbi:MAG: glycerophosphodiester phosphodiesterase [Deltaproteobacteria bacterium]|nr:glycerophosphodiester phosphodiesterase [Deltaproteobacteria bacterium]